MLSRKNFSSLCIPGNLFFVSDAQMRSLKKDLKDSRSSAYAEGTKQNMKIQWESFLMFCIYFGFKYLPTSTETLSLYAQFLSRSFKSTQSIKNYLSGIKTMHHLLGYSVDHINSFLINLSIKGMARLKPYCIKQSYAITPELLLQMSSILNLSDSSDIVYWCLFLFAFFLFARKSNLVPSTKKDFVHKKFLLRKDVIEESGYLKVCMKWSKTIQFGERILETPLIVIPDSILCPVSAYKKMCRRVKAKKNDPLFSLPDKSCITYRKYQSKLKQVISALKLDPKCYTTHGFRRGGTTYSFRSNVPSELIQLHGDWKSDAYKKYLEFSFEDKLQVALRMRQHILSE